MQQEFIRVVEESECEWFLYENVATAPAFEIDGYTCQRFPLDLALFGTGEASRLRYFIFGSRNGKLLNPMIGKTDKSRIKYTAVNSGSDMPWHTMLDISGLPQDLELPFFSKAGKVQAVANGVPLPMGEYLARIIKRDYYGIAANDVTTAPPAESQKRCLCGCGVFVYGRSKYAGSSCRKRAQRQRDKAA